MVSSVHLVWYSLDGIEELSSTLGGCQPLQVLNLIEQFRCAEVCKLPRAFTCALNLTCEDRLICVLGVAQKLAVADHRIPIKMGHALSHEPHNGSMIVASQRDWPVPAVPAALWHGPRLLESHSILTETITCSKRLFTD